jgi:hypothetical protein
MPRRLLSNLTYANVVATVALFAALGGSSYAAFTVSGRNVADESLTGRDIRNGSLGLADLSEFATVTRRRGRRGPRGRQGARGPAGPPGAQGPPGAPGATTVAEFSSQIQFVQASTGSAEARCAPGGRATGGGLRLYPESVTADTVVLSSVPVLASDGTPTGWRVEVSGVNPSGDFAAAGDVFVICAFP